MPRRPPKRAATPAPSSGYSSVLTTFLSWLADAALLAAFGASNMLSLMIAAWWGELAGIRPHRDKSGLGGFAAIYLFFGMRWALLAPLVVCATVEWLPGHWSIRLLVHLLLGFVSVRLFGRGIAMVQQDRVVPWWLGCLGAVLLPAPALWLGCEVVVPKDHAAPQIAMAVLLLLHALCFWRRRRELFRPEPPPPPSEVVDTDRGPA